MVKKISLTFFAQVHVLFADLFGSDNIINYWKMRICLDIFFCGYIIHYAEVPGVTRGIIK